MNPRVAAMAFSVALSAVSVVRAQGTAPRPLRLTFEGCAPRTERIVVDDLSRPERTRVRLVSQDESGAWQAQVRCEGPRTVVRVRAPDGAWSPSVLHRVDPHDLREVLLAPLEQAPPPSQTRPVGSVERAWKPEPAAEPRGPSVAVPPPAWRWALTFGPTLRGGTGAQPWLVGGAFGVSHRGASGFGVRVELSVEHGTTTDPQLGAVSLTLGGATVVVERAWALRWGTPALGVGVRGGVAGVREAEPRAREGMMPWGGSVLRGGVSLAIDGPWRVHVAVELGAAALPSVVWAEDRPVASVGPLWTNLMIAGEIAP